MAREKICLKSPLANSGDGRSTSIGSFGAEVDSSASVHPLRCCAGTVYGVLRASSSERTKRTPNTPAATTPAAIFTRVGFFTRDGYQSVGW